MAHRLRDVGQGVRHAHRIEQNCKWKSARLVCGFSHDPFFKAGDAKEFLQFDLLFVRRNGGGYCALRLHKRGQMGPFFRQAADRKFSVGCDRSLRKTHRAAYKMQHLLGVIEPDYLDITCLRISCS